MLQEIDLSQETGLFNETRAGVVIKNLQRRNMNGQYAQNREEALSAVMGMIPPGQLLAGGIRSHSSS